MRKEVFRDSERQIDEDSNKNWRNEWFDGDDNFLKKNQKIFFFNLKKNWKKFKKNSTSRHVLNCKMPSVNFD